jgi:hypothetical protein
MSENIPCKSSQYYEMYFSDLLAVSPNVTQTALSLLPCLQVCHRLHEVSLPLFFRDIKLIQQECTFEGLGVKLLRTMGCNPALAPLIRTLDISEYCHLGGPSLLPRALASIPRLRSLHLQLGDLKPLDNQAIQNIFFSVPQLETLVLENTRPNIHPASLADILRAVGSVDSSSFSNIRSLTCRSDEGSIRSWTLADRIEFVDADLFGHFLTRFPKLRDLDLSYTPIDPKSLFFINSNVRLKRLRITNCQGNDTSALSHFLATHPAANTSLVVLDLTRVRFNEHDTTIILENLPPTLRSLNLSHSSMSASQVPLLQKLCQHLEELDVGQDLTMDDIERMLMGKGFDFDCAEEYRPLDGSPNSKVTLGHELVLGPMRDAIAVCKLRRRIASVSPIRSSAGVWRSQVRYLNLSSIADKEQGRIANSVLLGEHSRPLQHVAVAGVKSEDNRVLQKLCGACGWQDKQINELVWVERS